MKNILIIFSSTDGHTEKICNRLKEVIEQDSNQATVVSIEDAPHLDLQIFDTIVIGASIRYGRHNKRILEFINKNVSLFESKSNALFSVNIVARKPEKSQPETNPYLRKLLTQIAWQPKELAVFAGKLDYPKYRAHDRWLIRLIMLITKGPTDPKTVVEFTNWPQVDAFGERISAM